MSHPSLGLPPRDLSAGDPRAAAALRRAGARLRVRALEAAIELDPTLRERHDELVRQSFLSDLVAFVDQLGLALASGEPEAMGQFADMVAVRYRKRRISMDDLVTLCDGLRRAASAVVDSDAVASVDAAIDEAVKVFRWHRRLAGDARKRNPILSFIYKGAQVTIKWVMSDPLVMNGEPFCYGTRLTVRNVLEMRRSGYTLARMTKDHPELRRMGVAAAYKFAAENRDRYAEFFEPDGSLAGPGYSESEAAGLPEQYRLPGVVIKPGAS